MKRNGRNIEPFANLRGANLRGADLQDAGLIIINLPIWTVYVHAGTIRIGCQHHSHKKWSGFRDSTIDKMDPRALEWWKQYKPVIMAAAKVVK